MRSGLLSVSALSAVMAFSSLPCLGAEGDSLFCRPRHSVSFIAGGGLHSLNPTFSGVDYEAAKPGGFGGVAYDYRLSKILSIGTGVEIVSYASRSETSGSVVTPDAVDLDGESFVHTLTLSHLAERQRAAFAEIPLRLSLTLPVAPALDFFFAAQAHLSLLMVDRYEVCGGTISTTGYYPQYRLTFDSDMPENGFYSISPSFRGSAGLRRAGVGVACSVGLLRSVSSSLAIRVGLYGRYSISDVAPSRRGEQYDPDCRRADGYSPRYNGALASASCQSAHPLSVGLSVGLRLSFGHRRCRVQDAVVPDMPAPVYSASRTAAAIASPPPASGSLDVMEGDVVLDSVIQKVDADIQTLIDNAGGIRFDMGSGELLGESAEAVARIAELLNANPDLNVSVTGHTCDVGTPEANMRIGLERAEAVAQCLEANGVDESRIRTSSAGASQPVAPNDTEENRMLNRRVKVEVRR